MGVLESFEQDNQELKTIFLSTMEKISKFQIFDQNKKVNPLLFSSSNDYYLQKLIVNLIFSFAKEPNNLKSLLSSVVNNINGEGTLDEFIGFEMMYKKKVSKEQNSEFLFIC